MKKVLAISSVLLGVVFLAGCGQQQTSQTQPTTPATNQAPITQPTPATPNNNTAPSETPEQIVSRLVKKENYMTVKVTDYDDSHIRAEINFNAPDCNTASPKGPCGGHFALFAKVSDEWKKVFEGQECVKKDIAQYNFPAKMLTSCY